MKAIILCVVALVSLAGCRKAADTLISKDPASGPSSGFTRYIIPKGQHYCEGNNFRAVAVTDMRFMVRFDSSVIYTTSIPANQYDINKLYGFSDNNSDHHQYSARIGWRWSDGALRLFGYVYNNGATTSREITAVPIGSDINCAIKVMKGSYLFTVNNITETMPRLSTTEKGSGYQLYPYFGGDEAAPHEVSVWVKDINE